MIAAVAGQRGEVLRSLKPKLVASALVLTVLGCSRNEAGTVRAASTSTVSHNVSAPTTFGSGGSLPAVKEPLPQVSTSVIAADKVSASVAPSGANSSVSVEPQSARVAKESEFPKLGHELRTWLDQQTFGLQLLRPRKSTAIALGTIQSVEVGTRHLLLVPFRWEESYCGLVQVDRGSSVSPFTFPSGPGGIWDCRRQMTLKSTLDLNGDKIPDLLYVSDLFTHQNEEYIAHPMVFVSDVGRQMYCYEDELSSAFLSENIDRFTAKQIQRTAAKKIAALRKVRPKIGSCNEVFRRYPP